jgi:hypothetical protein
LLGLSSVNHHQGQSYEGKKKSIFGKPTYFSGVHI